MAKRPIFGYDEEKGVVLTCFIKCVELSRDVIDQVTRTNEITTDIIIYMHACIAVVHSC